MNKILVRADQMYLFNPKAIPAGQSQFSEIKFDFSAEWDGMKKIAQFAQGATLLNVDVGGDGVCEVPPNLEPGGVKIRVKGYPADTGSAVIATANEVALPVSRGFASGGEPAVPPTPDLYQKLIDEMASQVKAKPFLVSVVYVDASTYHADKTFAQILAAYNGGQQVNAEIVNYPGVQSPMTLALTMHNGTAFVFSGTIAGENNKIMSAYVNDTDVWDVVYVLDRDAGVCACINPYKSSG